ncbi:MAG: hypothetical protein OEY51_12220, partial [Cyclobacteriaceae bacterium]|nr:hypothetical protein [Cyclobacteriaceae bacterium]
SRDSSLTLNLLLETARIALDEGLPVYIVFTMRSDYIGQCAAFRSLPEYIGFSQFFVPRLNRKELQEVIEGPAELSGITVTRRLSERLLFDIKDGLDQLPILQHTLNQIWKMADEGKEKLDLLQYAMVGGMAADELPEEEKIKFHQWFQGLPKKVQDCYRTPGLQYVLDTHANKIYESAPAYVKDKIGKEIPPEDIHLIIKTVFSCLTKIDHSRAVRNRMTLGEIRDILNRDDIEEDVIAATINIFREPGNTFIHPFIAGEGDVVPLVPENILDITHESLMRNWEILKTWADEEYNKYTVFADFKQQVDRWLAHDKSWGFLLPIGPLTYFEDWYKDHAPNPFWVNRYNEQITDTKKDIEESSRIVEDAQTFLKMGGRKHAITRAVMRFGPGNIAATLGILIILTLGAFGLYNNLTKRNSHVLAHIQKEGRELVNSDRVLATTKGFHLIAMERLESGSAKNILDNVADDISRLEVATAMAIDLNVNDTRGILPIFLQTVYYADSLAMVLSTREWEDDREKARFFSQLIELVDISDWTYYFHQEPRLAQAAKNSAEIVADMVLDYLQNPVREMNIKELNEGLEAGLNHHSFTLEERHHILQLLSPFEEVTTLPSIRAYYTREQLTDIGGAQDKLSFNGLYMELACLYASLGNTTYALQAMDSLTRYHPALELATTDGNTVGGYFALYSHWQALEDYANKHARNDGLRPFQVYRRMTDRTAGVHTFIASRFAHRQLSDNIWSNPVLEYLPDTTLDRLSKEFYRVLRSDQTITEEEREYSMALYYKQKGIFLAKRDTD